MQATAEGHRKWGTDVWIIICNVGDCNLYSHVARSNLYKHDANLLPQYVVRSKVLKPLAARQAIQANLVKKEHSPSAKYSNTSTHSFGQNTALA